MSLTSKRKHMLDVTIILLLSPIVVPVLMASIACIFLLEGRPVFYSSIRRVHRTRSMRIAKFRTMRRDAERIANRNTVPITTTRFLNIPSDSPLYTPIGRLLERAMVTEMPQLVYVLAGRMSLVGNRPLPENVVEALKVENDAVELRFATPAGLTGPAQLVGRDFISDADRLRLEGAYCLAAQAHYSALLDIKILFHTVMVGLFPARRFSPQQVLDLIGRHGPHSPAGAFGIALDAATPKSRTSLQG